MQSKDAKCIDVWWKLLLKTFSGNSWTAGMDANFMDNSLWLVCVQLKRSRLFWVFIEVNQKLSYITISWRAESNDTWLSGDKETTLSHFIWGSAQSKLMELWVTNLKLRCFSEQFLPIFILCSHRRACLLMSSRISNIYHPELRFSFVPSITFTTGWTMHHWSSSFLAASPI